MVSHQASQWRDYICSQHHAGRFLAPLGSEMSYSAPGALLDDDNLTEFLTKLRGGQSRALLLASAIDLLSPQCDDFFSADLPRVVDHLSNDIQKRDQIVGPGLRGNPLWQATVLGRLTGAIGPGRFYSRVTHRSFDQPENRLLRWLIDDVTESLTTLKRQAHRLPAALINLHSHCEWARSHDWLSSAVSPRFLEPDMIRAASRHRRPEYRRAAVLATRRMRLSQGQRSGRWSAIMSLLQSGWLAPVDDDDLFELYVLVVVMDVIQHELGFGAPTEYGLVIKGRDHVAKFRNDATEISVFFDQALSVAINAPSEYLDICHRHIGLDAQPRRPDISLKVSNGTASRVMIVEAKRSADGQYLRDSVYKAFGYLYDYQKLWTTIPQSPKVLLVAPEGITPRELVGDVTFVSADDRTNLVANLKRFLA